MSFDTSEFNEGYAENIYSTIVELSPLPVYVCAGKDMTVIVANKATLKAWGKDKSVIGRKFRDALPEMADQPFFDLLTRVYTTGVAYHTENDRADFLMDDRMQTFYFKFSYQPLRSRDGAIWGVLCIATDVTDLVLANKRAEESESRFKSLILQAPVALCVLKGPEYIVEVANAEVLEIWGVLEEQVLNKPLFEGIPEAKGQGLESLLHEVYTTGEVILEEERYVDLPKNGGTERKAINFVYAPYYEIDRTITGVMAAAVDVTDQVLGRQRVEEANKQLEKTQLRLALALQAGRLGTYERNLNTGKMLSSSQFKANFGFPPNRDVSVNDIMEGILPEYLAKVTEVQSQFEKDDVVYNIEFPVKWPDGTIHWVLVSGNTIQNELGERIISGVSQDITEQKLLQQQKDDFIGIASHELKTPITSLKASLQLLERLKNNPASPKLPALIDQANSSLKKVTVLIEDLLNTTRMKEGQLELKKTKFVLSKLINDCCQHVRALGTHDIVAEGDLDLEVYADSNRLDQVLINLVNNAIKYAPQSKLVVIKIKKADNQAKVSVIDKGPGIPKEKQAHLFDRYYRANENGQPYAGLGLGLYISSEIIKKHDGKIGVESETGKGSTFWFEIPLGLDKDEV
ncbi:PAS domain-containing sensor histidine kinase [Desertivirga xinjiangensis]|uniref:PAS domain-containing sensor histidine kinase n=1 Tax=Desertivirga xinjiangensis TaxID=539206 RepID=UPI00210AD758|nr:ATP-binding protein [Pedobacter xinjiangensis]